VTSDEQNEFMNYQDVQLVNQSLDQLGDSLLKTRMLDEQQREREAQTGIMQRRLQNDQQERQAQTGIMQRRLQNDQQERQAQTGFQQQRLDVEKARARNQSDVEQQRLQVDQARWNDSTKHWQKMEDANGIMGAFKDMVQSGSDFHDGMATLGQSVRDGDTTNDDANEYFKASYDLLPPPMQKKMAQDPSIQAALKNGLDWKTVGMGKAQREPGQFKTAPIANKEKWDADYQRAAALEAEAKEENDLLPVDRAARLDQAKTIRANADKFYLPASATRTPASDLVTVTTKGDEDGGTVSERIPRTEYEAQRTARLNARKAARANVLAAKNPSWTREQVLAAVTKEFQGK
jgi:hypothetical protein